MTNYGQKHSMTQPIAIEFTENKVFVAKNVTSAETDIDGHTVTEYTYDFISYDKDEYLMAQNEKIIELEQELQATKILLGVD